MKTNNLNYRLFNSAINEIFLATYETYQNNKIFWERINCLDIEELTALCAFTNKVVNKGSISVAISDLAKDEEQQESHSKLLIKAISTMLNLTQKQLDETRQKQNLLPMTLVEEYRDRLERMFPEAAYCFYMQLVVFKHHGIKDHCSEN